MIKKAPPSNEIDAFSLETMLSQALKLPSPKLLLDKANLGDQGALFIAKVVLSQISKIKGPLVCSVANNEIWSKGTAALARIIASRKLQRGSRFDFSGNTIGTGGLKAILKALKAAPEEFTLSISNCTLTDKDALEIRGLFVSGLLPPKSRIIFTKNNISPEMEKRLREASHPQDPFAATLIFGKEQAFQNPTPLALVLSLLRNNPRAKTITVNLSGKGLEDTDAIDITEGIWKLDRPLDADALTLNLKRNCISDKGAISLASLMVSQKLPAIFCLQLSFNNLGPEVVFAFIAALESAVSPCLVDIDLTSNSKITPPLREQLSAALTRKNTYFYFLQALALYQREFGTLLLPLAKTILDYVIEPLGLGVPEDDPVNHRLACLRIAQAWQFNLRNTGLSLCGIFAPPKIVEATPGLSYEIIPST